MDLPTLATAPTRAGARLLPAGVAPARVVVRQLLASVFGRPRTLDHGIPGDPGLLGPDAASWALLAEPAAIAGGVRALLVQLLHPRAMAGVADHSRFRDDPLGRLQATSAYVTASTFGDTRQALRVARRVREVHRHVRGHTPDGQPYAADDPDLLAWVSIALTSSFLAADRLWSPRPLDRHDADAFVAEQSRIASLLDPRVDPEVVAAGPDGWLMRADEQGLLPLIGDGLLPTTVAQLEQRLAAFHDELAVGRQAREALAFLRRPPLPLVVRPWYRMILRGAIGSLGPEQRRLLGLDWSAARCAAAVAQAGAVVTTMRASSGTSPARHLAQRRASAREPTGRW